MLIGASFLIMTAAQRGRPAFMDGASLFAATMVLRYLASTLYQAPLVKRVKPVLLVCDHSVTYLFIAGTCIPFTLGALWGVWGWAPSGFTFISGLGEAPVELGTRLEVSALGGIMLVESADKMTDSQMGGRAHQRFQALNA